MVLMIARAALQAPRSSAIQEKMEKALLRLSCISSVIFGAAHLYQGVAGVIVTAILGLIFSAIVLTTGTLVVPMILQALIGLRILLILRPKQQLAAEA
jgi:membrane protease YdiL (CAAX protease family)